MAKREQWPGFGKRVRERLRALGYIRADGTEDIATFTLEKRYVITLFHKYLDTTTPRAANLLRLAKDLQVSPGWLLFGDQGTHGPKAPRRQGRRTAGSLLIALTVGAAGMLGLPSPSVAGQAARLDVVQVREKVVASRTLRRWLARLLPLTPCPA